MQRFAFLVTLAQSIITRGIKMPCLFQIANPDIKDAVKGADVLVFVVPHQFVRGLCAQMNGHLKPGCTGISLIKVSTAPHSAVLAE